MWAITLILWIFTPCHLSHVLYNVAGIVHFLYKLNWVKGCPDSCKALFLGVSVRLFLEEITIWISRLKIASVSGHHPIHWGLKIEQKGGERTNLLSWLETGAPIFSCLQTSKFLVLRYSDSDSHPWLPCSQIFRFRL